jgi:two-component system, OmpR family, phosphate regulon response regulator PhoB
LLSLWAKVDVSIGNYLPGHDGLHGESEPTKGKEGPVMPKKILIIDDEQDVLLFLGTLLRKNGYDVCEACDGVQGMKKVIEEKPDLVCLDLIMPEKTGIKMYREMRKDDQLKSVPVIMVTGIESVDRWDFKDFKTFIRERSLPRPNGYIEKPIDKEQFLKAVKEVLGD